MTREERKLIAEQWAGIGMMYGREIPRPALTIMLDAISDLDSSDVIIFLKDWVRNSKLKSYPLPADIRSQLNPTMDPIDDARLASSRVIQAVSKYGSWNPYDAEQFVGDLGWNAVKRFGGWQYVCENLGVSLDVTTFQAQLRDICLSNVKAFDLGMFDKPIMLESKKRSNDEKLKLEREEKLIAYGKNERL